MNKNIEGLFHYESQKGLLSSIIVTFNSGDYLYEAIDSVLQQDYGQIELIISDDGSKDFDEDGIRLYIEKKKKNNLVDINIIHRENNIGTVRNVNTALAISKGEYIKILGGDDTYPVPDTFTRQVNCIERYHTIAAIGKAKQCNNIMQEIFDDRVERSNSDLPLVLKMSYKDARRYISKRDIFPIAIQAVCYHRKFFEKKGFCDEDYVLIDDATSSLMLLQEAEHVSYMDCYTVNHRAKVGISSSRELFAARRLLYYKDCVTFAEKEIEAYPDIYSYIYRKENVRINKFVYSMALSKTKKQNKICMIGIILKYFDAIVYYIFTNPRKFWERIKERVS